ncbi:MAG TPA: L,D-transpeptidase family protein [Stellaceae bacterium]|nr:L,D-transpeptidase family protein [Stellaceae bacterium]
MKRRAGAALHLAGALLAAGIAAPAVAAEFPLAAGQAVVGSTQIYVTRAHDTLLDVARRYDLGYTQLVAANRGVDPWLPRDGSRVIVPSRYLLPEAPRHGIVINLAERRLFYYPPGGRSVETFPVGVAALGLTTPLGATRVTAKQASPTWYPPRSIRADEPGLPQAVSPGPENPLGAFALVLGWPGYLIHGTNKPDGVGRAVSHGCIRLYPEDIARLYREIAVGTPVRIVDQEVAARWAGDELLVEVQPSREQADALDTGGAWIAAEPPDLVQRVAAAAGDRARLMDWAAVEGAGLKRTGMPVPVVASAAGATAERSPRRP